MPEDNVEVVRGLYDAWSRGNVAAFMDLLAPDVEWRFADNFIFGAKENPVIGRERLRGASLGSLKTEWDGFDGIPEEILDAGDQIVGLGHYVGTYKATGKALHAQFAHVFTIRGGKIVRWRQYVDTKQFADVVSAG